MECQLRQALIQSGKPLKVALVLMYSNRRPKPVIDCVFERKTIFTFPGYALGCAEFEAPSRQKDPRCVLKVPTLISPLKT